MNALGAAFTGAVCWALGTLLFRRLRISLMHLEHDLLAGITGAALLSLIGFVLCSVHMARTPVFLALGLAALAGGIQVARTTARRESLPPFPASGPASSRLGLFCIPRSTSPTASPPNTARTVPRTTSAWSPATSGTMGSFC